MPVIEQVREIPQVFIDMPLINGFKDLNINGDVKLEITGKVKSLSQNEQKQSMRVEVSDVKVTSRERNDDGLGRLRKAMDAPSKPENRPIPSPPG